MFTQLNDTEVSLVDAYRDLDAYYEDLDSKHKVIYQLWARTGSVQLFTLAFPGFVEEQAIQSLKISTPKGSQQFQFFPG